MWNRVDFMITWERLKEVSDWNMEYLVEYKWVIIDTSWNVHI